MELQARQVSVGLEYCMCESQSIDSDADNELQFQVHSKKVVHGDLRTVCFSVNE